LITPEWQGAIERWAAVLSGQIADSTLKRYRFALNQFVRHVAPLGHTPASITPEIVAAWLESLRETGPRASWAMASAACKQFLEVLQGKLVAKEPPPPAAPPFPPVVAATTPPAKEPPMRAAASDDEVEPVEIGGGDADYEIDDEEGPIAPPAPVHEPSLSQLAEENAKAAVKARLMKQLEKANSVKANKAAQRRAAEDMGMAPAANSSPRNGSAATGVFNGLRFAANQKVALHKRREDGSLAFCQHYTSTDFRNATPEGFVSQYAVPKWGHGAYEISLLDSNNNPVAVHSVAVEPPLHEAKMNVDDPLYMVKELMSLSQNGAPDAAMKRARLMATLGLGEVDRPLTTRDLEKLMALQQPATPPQPDIMKIFELAERMAAKREPPAQPMMMPPPPPAPTGPDPTMMMMMESMKQQSQMMMQFMQLLVGAQNNKPTGPDPFMVEVMKQERDRAERLEQRIENLRDQPSTRTLAESLHELREAQEIVKGIPGFEAMSGEGAGLAGFFNKLIENAPAVGDAVGRIAENLAQVKVNAVRNAIGGQKVLAGPTPTLSPTGPKAVMQPTVPVPHPVRPLPEVARVNILKLASATDDAEITQAAIDTVVALANDPVWAENLKPYQQALQTGDDEAVAELVISLFAFANIGQKATAERVDNIVLSLKRLVEPALEDEDDDDDEGDEEGDEEGEGEEGDDDDEYEDDDDDSDESAEDDDEAESDAPAAPAPSPAATTVTVTVPPTPAPAPVAAKRMKPKSEPVSRAAQIAALK
jgi:hypothetical protein